MTSIQTTVDDDIADAFTQWAEENYKSKAAALRDYIKKAPKGESVHSATTNEDLEDQIEDLRDTIESGSINVQNQTHQNQEQNSAESENEDVDLIEMYDPDVDAEELPDDLTPEHDDESCVRKDILESVVKKWEETGEVPELNPTHISTDHRPQGGDTPVALGIGIIQHRFENTIQHSSIVDVLASDNGGLGYTKQYVRENGHAHDIAGTMVPVPGEDGVYIVDDDVKSAALTQTEHEIETEVQALENADDWRSFDASIRKLDDLLKDLRTIKQNMGVTSQISEDDVNDDIIAAGRDLSEDLFFDALADAEGVVEEFEERLEEMRDADTYPEYVAADPDYNRVINAKATVQKPGDHDDPYGALSQDDLSAADDVQDRFEEVRGQIKRVRYHKQGMIEESEKRRVEYRELGVQNLVDIAMETEDLSVAESAVNAIDDLHACKHSTTRQTYADLTIEVDYQSMRSKLTRNFRQLESCDWGLWG